MKCYTHLVKQIELGSTRTVKMSRETQIHHNTPRRRFVHSVVRYHTREITLISLNGGNGVDYIR